jgi:hypothetical protein
METSENAERCRKPPFFSFGRVRNYHGGRGGKEYNVCTEGREYLLLFSLFLFNSIRERQV